MSLFVLCIAQSFELSNEIVEQGRLCLQVNGCFARDILSTAKSAVMTAHKRGDPISQWAHQLREKSGWQKAVVALANKNARILWAVFVRGRPFDARHVSVKPGIANAAA